MSHQRNAWLEERKNFVTASDVAALLGESPYKTRDQLRMEKLGLADEWSGAEHTDIALALEVPVLEIAYKRYGWSTTHNTALVQDSLCPRLAATPDAFVTTPWGDGVIQIKWTACKAKEDCRPLTSKGKPSEAAYLHGPPLHYQLQVQAELACTGLNHGCLLVMHEIPTLKLRPYYIARHEGAISRIRREALIFWEEIETWRREHD